MQVVGARPNFMKAAPLCWEFRRRPGQFTATLIHTGQHYDSAMSDVFFRELDIPKPDENLEVGSSSHAQQTAQVMIRFEPLLAKYQPDWVIVPGDVNSTLACALVAAKLGFKVAHLEAGLRSFDRAMPEEVNRVVTDHVSDLLLTPSADGNQNLEREGVPAERVHLVGNIMIDTLVKLLPKADEGWPALQSRWDLRPGKYILATLHRPSNVDDPGNLAEILAALQDLAQQGLQVLFPVHPRTRQRLSAMGWSEAGSGITLSEPLGYLEFLALQKYAALVITDSGGVQEETTYLGVPCLTARPNTERPVTITDGTNTLVASRRGEIVGQAQGKLSDRSPRRVPPLWDGRTAARIADLLS